ncbi:hypothetical protein SAMN05421678_101329 [Actinopolymorpha cephalotaxi]|uniref:Uncharacterized protein n=1 Tax=Actinopolymorpha cephalotaxi TaxID=504797 RepID=A0A1I2KNK2_9ACTN|nr:hypothetical protein [Actinopolymorpha cephalotaxi]NYH84471.1 hypothetical protein [Actinopolymorpha cephalotaxi]SFF66701.1 hypothetical protein SAMN05421678_101329 [Actinopolymorpha cephalotaxi]
MITVKEQLAVVLVRLHARLLTGGRERGDLVGFALITVMTAALVAVLWAFLGPQLQSMLQDAINKARGSIPG